MVCNVLQNMPSIAILNSPTSCIDRPLFHPISILSVRDVLARMPMLFAAMLYVFFSTTCFVLLRARYLFHVRGLSIFVRGILDVPFLIVFYAVHVVFSMINC